jgi:hypothetical protein
MSSYETLLENYNIEKSYENDSFSNMMACFESLNAFVNEDVNFEVTISLEEAESGIIRDNFGKIKEAAKRTTRVLEKEVSDFIIKIKDALSRFTAKAKITIDNKCNEDLKKMLDNSELVIGKDIKLKVFKNNKSNNYIYDRVNKTLGEVYTDYISALDLKYIVSILAEDISKSNIVEDVVLTADKSITVKAAFDKYVDPLLKNTKDNLSNAQDVVNDSIRHTKTSIKLLKRCVATLEKIDKDKKKTKKYKRNTAKNYNKYMNGLKEVISLLMKVSTRYINYVGTVLVMAASNATKIALAAVEAN